MEKSLLDNYNFSAVNSTSKCLTATSSKCHSELLYTEKESIAQAASLVLIVLSGLAGNGYVGYVIYRSKSLKNPTFVFILNLVIANIGALSLCTPLPFVASIQRKYSLGKVICKISGFMNNLFFCASIFTLSLIAVHKYFSVVRPKKRTCFQMSLKKTNISLAVLWVACGIMSIAALGPFSAWEYITFNPTTSHCGIAFPKSVNQRIRLAGLAAIAFVIPLALMCYAYMRIYLTVKFHEQRLNNVSSVKRMNPVKRKIAITLCLMFGTFVACWTPFFILITLSVAMGNASNLPSSLGRIAYWCGYLNCCINPALYCFRTSSFKEIRQRTSSNVVTHRSDARMRSRRAISLPNLPLPRSLSSVITGVGLNNPSSQVNPRSRAYSLSASTGSFGVNVASFNSSLLNPRTNQRERKVSRQENFSTIWESTAERVEAISGARGSDVAVVTRNCEVLVPGNYLDCDKLAKQLHAPNTSELIKGGK